MSPEKISSRSYSTGRLTEIIEKREKNADILQKEAPTLFAGFSSLMKEYYTPSALDVKYKELIAIGLSVSRCCVPCLAVHALNAYKAGANREEILDAASIGIEFGGGPAYVVVRENLIEFLNEIEEKNIR
jgi:AhpD family alkylhydroperoxidase